MSRRWDLSSDAAAGLGPATVIHADARSLPLPDGSVDLIVTSPPYFAVRSYQDGGVHYDGQVGSEATPQEFVDALIDCTREMVRVLEPTGTIWVNLGDKYSQRVAARPSSHQDGLFPDRPELVKDWKRDRGAGLARMPYENVTDTSTGRYVPEKSLMGLPWRYALRCIDELGLILRAEVIWSKPTGLPESVTDRVRRSHETWFHFVRQPRYFSAVDELREPHSEGTHAGRTRSVGSHSGNGLTHRRFAGNTDSFNPYGKLPGSVRVMAASPLRTPPHLGISHHAAFPPAWPSWIVRGWSPTGICLECGQGRRPVVASVTTDMSRPRARRAHEPAQRHGLICSCEHPDARTRPAVVLDPFGGTGTTAMAARSLGRHGISLDLSADYCQLARWRIDDRDELAAVRGLARAGRARVPAQPGLFDTEERPGPAESETESVHGTELSPQPGDQGRVQ